MPNDGSLIPYVLAAAVAVPPALLVLAILAWRRLLRPQALWSGPNRAIGLGAADILIGVGLVVLGTALFQAVALQILPVDPQTGARLDPPPPAPFIRLVLVGQLMTQLPPAAFFLWRATHARHGTRRVGLTPRRPGRDLASAALGLLSALPLVFALNAVGALLAAALGQEPEQVAHTLLPLFQGAAASSLKLLLAVSVVVVGPALEELIYRGLLQSSIVEMLGRRRRWTAIWITGAIFGVMHFGAATWYALPALVVFGVCLGWLYERSGSLWPPILAHAGFNALNVLVTLALPIEAPPPA